MVPGMGGRSWGVGDLTGGPLDEVLRLVRVEVPDLVVERLVMPYPGDDDNVYFLERAAVPARVVQIDTHEDGKPTFYLEAEDRAESDDAAAAAGMVVHALKTGRLCPSIEPEGR